MRFVGPEAILERHQRVNGSVLNTQYEELLADVLEHGVEKPDRTGTGTRSVFGRRLRYDLTEGFPVITTKKVYLKAVIGELLWFLDGASNVKPLQDQGIRIWNEWADENGELGPVYGKQWRSWPTESGESIDQISELIETINTNPDSRRMLVSAWNVGQLDDMALVPCHAFFQVYVANGELSLQVYQRSADLFLGVPFNISSYALLTEMIAAQTGLVAKELIWVGGDCHIYSNHVEQVEEQLSRDPYPFPTLKMDPEVPSLFDYTPESFETVNYKHHPTIKATVAV